MTFVTVLERFGIEFAKSENYFSKKYCLCRTLNRPLRQRDVGPNCTCRPKTKFVKFRSKKKNIKSILDGRYAKIMNFGQNFSVFFNFLGLGRVPVGVVGGLEGHQVAT